MKELIQNGGAKMLKKTSTILATVTLATLLSTTIVAPAFAQQAGNKPNMRKLSESQRGN
jgi:hypothetical protein